VRSGFRRVFLLVLVAAGTLVGSGVFAARPDPFVFDGQLSGRVLLKDEGGFSFSLESSELLVRLRASEWAAYGRAVVSNSVLGYLSLGADGRLGPVMFFGQMVFDPSHAHAPFRNFTLATSWHIGDVRMGNVIFLADPPENSFDQLYVHGAIPGLSGDAYVRFSLCDSFAFQSVQLSVDAVLFTCAIPLHGTVSFSAENGFDGVELIARRIPLAILSGPALDTSLELRVRFGLTDKILIGTLRTAAGSLSAAVEPYVEFIGLFPEITGILVYGVELRCALGESLSVALATCFDRSNPTHNFYVTGENDYYERASLAGAFSGCCGSLGGWTVDVYWEEGSSALFGLGRLDVGVLVPLGAALSGSLEAEFESAGAWRLHVGFTARL
jgi:hypothetical protein